MTPDLRILVLDDNPNDRVLATRALATELPGAAVDASVTDLDAFRAAVGTGRFDLVITDFQLKWSDGLQVLRAVKSRQPHVPVVMFTATGTEEVAVEGMKSGLDDYVIKSPVHYLRLAIAARGALERAKFRAERARVLEDLRRAKEDAERAREQAEAAGRLKDDFLSIVSHELRTPLNAILGWATLLRGGGLDAAEAAHGVEIIERNARAQARLVDDLLDVSRIVTGRLRVDVRPVELSPVVEAAVDTVRGAADAKGVRIEQSLDGALGGAAGGAAETVSVTGDPDRLQQVAWNLLSNAVRFTPAGGRVRVWLERAGTHARLTVSDTGEGIAPEFLPHVFDRFRQSENPTTRRHGGLGIGLTLVRHLVELHGGTVRAESPGEGKGATFVVALPLAASPAGVEAHRPADPTAPRSRSGNPHPTSPDAPDPPLDWAAALLEGVKVLAVDDEADSRELLQRLLSRCGADVSLAASAAEAMDVIGRAPPDVLVCDIGMPGEDGYGLIERVRVAEGANRGRLPAVALTAFARPEDRRRAILAGYQVHLPKPLDAAEFVAAVANLAAGAARRPATGARRGAGS